MVLSENWSKGRCWRAAAGWGLANRRRCAIAHCPTAVIKCGDISQWFFRQAQAQSKRVYGE
jgi:hypothetical protein